MLIWIIEVVLALAIPAAFYCAIGIIRSIANPPDCTRRCRFNLRTLYYAIDFYGKEHGTLPAKVKDTDEWAQFLEEYLEPDYVRKVLACPSERNNYTGKSKWKSSYKINPEVLRANWEIISKLHDIPLLIEKNPNHDGRYHILFTDGTTKLIEAK